MQEVVIPKIKIDTALVADTKILTEEIGQVILHCSFTPISKLSSIRISRNTYIYDETSDHKSKLIHVEAIPIAPEKRIVKNRKTAYFTLVFTGLPKSCTHFKFVEIEPHGENMDPFLTPTIFRNSTDVYDITLK